MKRILDDLKIFCTVVEWGSMKQAASHLGMPHSTVSRRIDALEKSLGLPLLQRTTREVAVTNRGQQLYDECASQLSSLDQSIKNSMSDEALFKGSIKISMPQRAGLDFLGLWLIDFANQHQGLQLELSLTNIKENLVQAHIDLAFRVGPLADSTATAVRLWDIPYTLCANRQFIESQPINPQQVSLEQLANLPCVISLPAKKWQFIDHNKKELTIMPRQQLIVDDLELARYAVKNNPLVAMLPVSMTDDENIVPLCIPQLTPLTRTMFAYQMGKRHTMKQVRIIVEAIKSCYADRLNTTT